MSALPDETLGNLVGLGIGGLLLMFVGRQMIRLWSAWSEFARTATDRSEDDQARADRLQVLLSEASLARARAETRCDFLEREVERLQAIIAQLHGDDGGSIVDEH